MTNEDPFFAPPAYDPNGIWTGVTDWTLVNGRKMAKAIYLLLERCHRSHGLGVVGCFRPVGAEYFYFYSHAVRDGRGRAKYLAEEAFPHGYALAIDQWRCRLVGQHDAEFAGWSKREVRTAEIVDWLDRHMSHRQVFSDHPEDLQRWRSRYTVGESERYLLAWNVLGHLATGAAELGEAGIATSGRFDMFDYEFDAEAVRLFGLKHPEENVHYCRGIAVSSDARAYAPGQPVRDLWTERLEGRSGRELAASLLDASWRAD